MCPGRQVSYQVSNELVERDLVRVVQTICPRILEHRQVREALYNIVNRFQLGNNIKVSLNQISSYVEHDLRALDKPEVLRQISIQSLTQGLLGKL